MQHNKEVYNRIAQHFSETRREVWGTFRVLADYAKPGDSVLDLGCGNGRLYQLFEKNSRYKERTMNKVHYVGVDFSRKLLKQARMSYPKVEFRLGDVRAIPADSRQFDVVFCLAVFHHLPTIAHRRQALREVRRVLKPGGYFIMTNWNLHAEWVKEKLETGNMKLGKRKQEYIVPWKDPQGHVLGERYYYAYTSKYLRELLTRAGLSVEKQYYDKTWWAKGIKEGSNLVTIARTAE